MCYRKIEIDRREYFQLNVIYNFNAIHSPQSLFSVVMNDVSSLSFLLILRVPLRAENLKISTSAVWHRSHYNILSIYVLF